MNTSWYLDLNHIARDNSWANGFMHWYALYGGVAILALLILVAWWRARYRDNAPRAVAMVVWTVLGTLVALGVNQIISHAVGEARPYSVIHGALVLVPRAHDFSFPSDHATAAGAIIMGLLLVDRPMATLAAILGFFLAFARVYVGAHYPGDVVAGLAVGAFVVLVLSPLAMAIIGWITSRLARTPLRPLVASGSARAATTV